MAGTSRSCIGYELVLAGYDLVGYEMNWVQLDHLPPKCLHVITCTGLGELLACTGICMYGYLYLGVNSCTLHLELETSYHLLVVVVSQLNGTSTPKGSYSAKTGDNDCKVNSSGCSL